MKKIILSLTAGLAIGFGVSVAMENSEITTLQAKNVKAQLQVAKLSEQLLAKQAEQVPVKQAPRLVQRAKPKPKPKPKTLTSGSLHKSSRSKEQMLAQRKEAIERMRYQQLNAQKSSAEQDQNKAETLDNGIVL